MFYLNQDISDLDLFKLPYLGVHDGKGIGVQRPGIAIWIDGPTGACRTSLSKLLSTELEQVDMFYKSDYIVFELVNI